MFFSHLFLSSPMTPLTRVHCGWYLLRGGLKWMLWLWRNSFIYLFIFAPVLDESSEEIRCLTKTKQDGIWIWTTSLLSYSVYSNMQNQREDASWETAWWDQGSAGVHILCCRTCCCSVLQVSGWMFGARCWTVEERQKPLKLTQPQDNDAQTHTHTCWCRSDITSWWLNHWTHRCVCMCVLYVCISSSVCLLVSTHAWWVTQIAAGSTATLPIYRHHRVCVCVWGEWLHKPEISHTHHEGVVIS